MGLLHGRLLLVFGQILVCVDLVDLLFQSFISGSVSNLVCQRSQILDVVRLVNHIRRTFNVLVKALHRVICGVKTFSFLCVSEPCNARLKGVGHAVDAGWQIGDICGDSQRCAKACQQSRFSRLEVGEISLPVCHWLITVSQSDFVHLLEQFVIDCAELVYRVVDLCPVHVRVVVLQLLNRQSPFLQRLAVSHGVLFRAVFQHADVVFCFAQ